MCVCQWVSYLRHNVCLMSSHLVVSLCMTFFCSPSIISASAGLRVLCAWSVGVYLYTYIRVCADQTQLKLATQGTAVQSKNSKILPKRSLALFLSRSSLSRCLSDHLCLSLPFQTMTLSSRKPEDSKQNISKHDSRGATESANADVVATTKTATATACQVTLHIFVHCSSRRQSSQGRGRGPRRRPRPEPFGDNTHTEQVLKVKLKNGNKEHMM